MLAQIYWDRCTRYFYPEILIQFAWNALGSNTHMACSLTLCSSLFKWYFAERTFLNPLPKTDPSLPTPFSATVFNESHWSTRTPSRPGKPFTLVWHTCINVHNRKVLGASLPHDSQEMFLGAVSEMQMDNFEDRFNFLMF